jgi:uncharacterized membrane protein YkvA (DUF1232 family)
MLDSWKRRTQQLKTEVVALYIAYRDPRVSWGARIVAALVVGYALSPIDLIPDPIPVLGYLDDLVLIPLGLMLALRMIPPDVMADARQQAQMAAVPVSRTAAVIIVLLWVVMIGVIGWLLVTRL